MDAACRKRTIPPAMERRTCELFLGGETGCLPLCEHARGMCSARITLSIQPYVRELVLPRPQPD
jgi:hypothetical protein